MSELTKERGARQQAEQERDAHKQGRLAEVRNQAKLVAEVERLRKALESWERFAQHCNERNITVPLWAAVLNDEACRLTREALGPDAANQRIATLEADLHRQQIEYRILSDDNESLEGQLKEVAEELKEIIVHYAPGLLCCEIASRIYGRITAQPKPCETCGGTKTVPIPDMVRRGYNDDTVPCPRCTKEPKSSL